MIQKKKLGVDVILDVLEAAHTAYPDSVFISSLLFQYQERGGLSKKQLEGLFGKASKISSIPESKLATLQAIILKKPAKYKSEKPTAIAIEQKDENLGNTIDAILEKFPQHKRLLFYKAMYDSNKVFSAAEKTEIEKFKKLLLKDSA